MEKSKEAPSTEDPYNISLSELEIPIDEPDKKGGLIKTNTGKYSHLRETSQLIYSVNQYFGVYGIDAYDFKCINRKDWFSEAEMSTLHTAWKVSKYVKMSKSPYSVRIQ